jgi:hypothetical protein
VEDDRYAAGLPPQGLQHQRGADNDNFRFQSHEFHRIGAYARGVGTAPAIVEADVAAVAPTELFKRLPQRRLVRLCVRIALGERTKHADAPHALALLRPRRERQGCRRAEQRYELAAPS